MTQQQQQQQQQPIELLPYADASHKQQSSISSINIQPTHNAMGHYTTSMAQSYTPPSMQQMPPPGVMPNFTMVVLVYSTDVWSSRTTSIPQQQQQQQQQQPYQQRQQPQQQNIAQPIYNNHSHNPSWSSVSSFGGGKTIYGSNNW